MNEETKQAIRTLAVMLAAFYQELKVARVPMLLRFLLTMQFYAYSVSRQQQGVDNLTLLQMLWKGVAETA